MDDDEENLCPFGTPLEPLEEDEIPSKKPISVEDQIVTDSNGRRRFHGAFTGGFSAGFWNTVGSLEGWKPQSFKSSRTEKAKQLEQNPMDFMDDEDLGEFGIAPQRVQTTEDFTPQEVKDAAIRKRKLQQKTFGPIPGVPVLHQLLKPTRENVAICLLKKMGWKVGQGIGARQTRKQKKATAEINIREKYVMKRYGCNLGPLSQQDKNKSSSDDDCEEEEEHITFAPDDFDPYVCTIKDNTFGLGYSGLNPNSLSDKQEHVNLFGNAFEVMGENNKKLSIRGQAFGVGAMEEEDEDIYAPDDMTKYDFSLEEKKIKTPKKVEVHDETCIDGFCSTKNELTRNKKVFIVKIPAGFQPRNWAVRKSRFEPMSEDQIRKLKQQDEYKTKGLGRHDLDPEQRKNILEEFDKNDRKNKEEKEKINRRTTYLEKINDKYKTLKDSAKEKEENKTINAHNEILIDEETRKENEKILSEAQKITEKMFSKPNIFKPFINNEAKQERYEKFLEADLRDADEIMKFLLTIQPLSMSDWDREMEKREFLQAKRIYKPLTGIMSDRFITSSGLDEQKKPETENANVPKKVEIKRTRTMWKPCALLCKRFNVPEPFGGTMVEEKQQKPKLSIFDYLEASVHRKDNFVAPVIIPKKVEKPLPIISQQNKNDESSTAACTSSRLPSKDFFTKKDQIEASSSKNIMGNREKEYTKSIGEEIKQKIHEPKTELEKKIEETKDKHPSEKIDIFKSIFESSDDEESEIEEKNENNHEITDDINKITKELTARSATNITKDIYATLTKSATELNIIRNTSPPRGIFANLFTRKSETITASSSSQSKESSNKEMKNQNNSKIIPPISSNETKNSNISKQLQKDNISKENETKETTNDLLLYGPKLPTNFNVAEAVVKTNGNNSTNESSSSSNESDEVDRKLMKILKQNKNSKSKIIEEWVEKSEIKVEREKKKKKKKDKKKKSKKHKKHKKR